MVDTFGVDELNPGNPDFLVRAGPVFCRGVRFERSANGRTLLELLNGMHDGSAISRQNAVQLPMDRHVEIAAGKSIPQLFAEITTCQAFGESVLERKTARNAQKKEKT
ncbi:hypothetical protein [Rhizobium giardinii]|uniref:Uncharacterized protein n=2 Tax=Rhizobium giardinii TaxID=56731 RepID=A0A7W8X662_9HYPH|nr:hypothetical protein [Rhizobium giardinii]MBB5533346.1 hypothetical protein [Rhizobium giardinii]